MSKIPIEKLLEKVDITYRLVNLAAMRAKEIYAIHKDRPKTDEAIAQALEEIASGKITYFVRPANPQEKKQGSRRDSSMEEEKGKESRQVKREEKNKKGKGKENESK